MRAGALSHYDVGLAGGLGTFARQISGCGQHADASGYQAQLVRVIHPAVTAALPPTAPMMPIDRAFVAMDLGGTILAARWTVKEDVKVENDHAPAFN